MLAIIPENSSKKGMTYFCRRCGVESREGVPVDSNQSGKIKDCEVGSIVLRAAALRLSEWGLAIYAIPL